MRKALVIMPTFYPSNDANTLCMMRILADSNEFEYTVLTENDSGILPDNEKINGINIVRYNIKSARKDLHERKLISLFRNMRSYIKAKKETKEI